MQAYMQMFLRRLKRKYGKENHLHDCFTSATLVLSMRQLDDKILALPNSGIRFPFN